MFGVQWSPPLIALVFITFFLFGSYIVYGMIEFSLPTYCMGSLYLIHLHSSNNHKLMTTSNLML